MPKTAPYRVVVVGCGGMANAWVRIALTIKDVQLVGLVDIARQQALNMAAKHNLPESLVFDTLAQAVKATDANVVFDVTIPAVHDKVTIEALNLGCHVLGEKPMSDTLAKARRMVATASKTGKTYGVTQTRRPNPNLLSAVKFLRGGKLGTIEEIHSDFYIGAHFGGFRDAMDYPLILDMAIHTFDNARQFTEADPVSVYCQSWNPPHSWYKGDASACCIFEMRDKAGNPIIYTYRGSWCNEGLQTSWNGDWRVVCAKGTLRWDGEKSVTAQRLKPKSKPAFYSEMESLTVPPLTAKYDGHESMLRDFIDALKKGRKPICDCQDNIKSLAMVLAAVQSAKSGKKVAVKW